MAPLPFPARPWLKSPTYVRMMQSDVILHYDAYAYRDAGNYLWLRLEARQGGRVLCGSSVYVVTSLGLEPREALPEAVIPAYWTRGTHATFRVVHPMVLGMVRNVPESFARATVHFHYITCTDADPWPRNMVNTYRYTVRPDDPRTKRRTPPLPDIL
jgi:hypothetical protein